MSELARRTSGRRLRVSPIGCQGHGACAELLPELIRRDEWATRSSIPGRFRPNWWPTPAAR